MIIYDDLFCSMTLCHWLHKTYWFVLLVTFQSSVCTNVKLANEWGGGSKELWQICAPSKTQAGLMLLPTLFWAEKPTASHRKLSSSDTANYRNVANLKTKNKKRCSIIRFTDNRATFGAIGAAHWFFFLTVLITDVSLSRRHEAEET